MLVVSNNPVLTFMLEVLASAPRPADFQSALAALGASRRGEERLELHIAGAVPDHLRELRRDGPGAGLPVAARRGSSLRADLSLPALPATKANVPWNAADLERLNLPGNDSLHRARALSRVAEPRTSIIAAVKEALAFLPRPAALRRSPR